MIDHKFKTVSRSQTSRGAGLFNSLINNLPVELHLPGYQYCGPGTRLTKRLARGDSGINPLDQACKEHDIAYTKYYTAADRHKADKVLAEKAWQRVKAKDSKIGEKINSWFVANAMKAKAKLGLGLKNKSSKTSKCKNGRKVFQRAVKNAKNILRQRKPEQIQKAINMALLAAKKTIKGEKSTHEIPRIIPVPKTGGVLPFLIPLFAGLSAVGALSGGAAGIARAVNQAQSAKKELKESQRHNKTMEAIAMGKGLYIRPYKKGLGFYLNPKSKNF